MLLVQIGFGAVFKGSGDFLSRLRTHLPVPPAKNACVCSLFHTHICLFIYKYQGVRKKGKISEKRIIDLIVKVGLYKKIKNFGRKIFRKSSTYDDERGGGYKIIEKMGRV